MQPHHHRINRTPMYFNPLNAELNPLCYLLALLGAHHFLHVSRIRVKSLILRLLMLYIYIYRAPILDVSRSHTTTNHSRKDSSGRVISSSQRPLPDDTRHSQQTNIHVPGGIRTQDLSKWAAAGRSPAKIIRKPEAATAVWRAPDDGHNNARNMLSSVCTTKQ